MLPKKKSASLLYQSDSHLRVGDGERGLNQIVHTLQPSSSGDRPSPAHSTCDARDRKVQWCTSVKL